MKLRLLKTLILTLAACGLVFVFSNPGASATVNPQISFQGKLTNADGTNVADGNYSIRFRIYTDPSADTGTCANTCKWEETQGTVAVGSGVFAVNLGSVTTLPGSVDFNVSALYLGIKVGADSEMTPRVRLTTSPQAFNSDLLDGLDSTAFAQVGGTQTWSGANTLQTTANATALTVKQSSNGTPTADIFNVQTANNTNIIQVTGPSANNAAVSISSIGGSSGLTLQSGSGTVTLGTSTVLTAAAGLSVSSGGTGTLNLGNGGSANIIQIGNTTGAVAQTINIGTNATGSSSTAITVGSTIGGTVTLQSAATINIGANAAAQTINIGNSTGATGVDIACGTGVCRLGQNAIAHTVTIGNQTGASAVTIDSGTGTINIGTGAQARAVNIGTGTAAQTVLIGSSSSTSSLDLQAGTGGIDITTQGTGALAIGNNAVAQTIAIGNSTGATTVSVLCGTGACGFGNNAIAHATTLGSNTGTASTLLQAGTGNLSLTSGGNIMLGTSDTTATLLILDAKTSPGDPVTPVNGGSYYNSSNNKFRCAQNSVWSDCISGFNTITKTADQAATQNSTTLQNDTTLLFPVVANGTYIFDAWIPVNASNATADLKYSFVVPAGASFNASTVANATICGIIASGTACAYTATNPIALMLQVRGVVIVGGTAGNVQFQFSQNTAAAGVSFPVVKKGAALSWRQSN